MDWLGTRLQQIEAAGQQESLDELFRTPTSIGSLIIQASSVALTYLHLCTKTHELVRTDDNPDRAQSKQQSTLDMLKNMAARASTSAGPTSAMPPPGPMMSSNDHMAGRASTSAGPTTAMPPPGPMMSSSDPIPRLADTHPPQQDPAYQTSNESAALHISKGKGKGKG